MKGHCGVFAKPKNVAHISWKTGFIDKGNMRYPAREIWLKRGGMGKISGNGPQGWKLKPARLLSRSLAEMAIKYGRHRK